MNPTEAEALIRAVLQENISEDTSNSTLVSTLAGDLGFDELDFVETACGIEKRAQLPLDQGGVFQTVEIPDEEIQEWETLQDIVDTLVRVTAPGYGSLSGVRKSLSKGN